MQPVVDSIHELYVGVEALGSQLDLHLAEEMVVVWRQVRTVRRGGRKSPSWRAWLKHLWEPQCGATRCRAGERHLYWASRTFFSSTSEAYSVFHNKPLVPGAMNSINKIPFRSQNMYLTVGGSSVDSDHVSSVITPTLSGENTWREAFSDRKLYLLLLSVRFGAMTTYFFLPTNRRLILELPMYYIHGTQEILFSYPHLACWLEPTPLLGTGCQLVTTFHQ